MTVVDGTLNGLILYAYVINTCRDFTDIKGFLDQIVYQCWPLYSSMSFTKLLQTSQRALLSVCMYKSDGSNEWHFNCGGAIITVNTVVN